MKPQSRLRRVMEAIGVEDDHLIEIHTSAPVVFCFGLRRTRICISDGLVRMLDDAELRSVLLHEWHHLQSHDPLRFFVLKYFQSILFFVPGMTVLIQKYITLSELAADERATNNFSEKVTLARAIYKLTSSAENNLIRAGLALSFFGSVITERVNRLSDDAYVPRFVLFGRGLLLGVSSMIVALLFLFVVLADPSNALSAGGASCVSPEQRSAVSNACKIESHPPVCPMNYNGYQSTTATSCRQ
ncbi:M56 family metallopeptidase [Candidatus Uhrbacteria bacterium]|nr:M56 family metallopeptidase [Candidatus Uhrbacteria bacterium]